MIKENVISNNGVSMLDSNSNIIFLNNFVNSYASSTNSINHWNSTSPITYTYNNQQSTSYLGNYWSAYSGSDSNNDGIGDSSYQIDSNNTDSYPLIAPKEVYEISTPQNQPPTASFTFSPSSPAVGQTVTFDASSSYDPDGSIVSYSWNFGDGSTASGAVVQHSYSSPGTYTVTLTVTDNNGLTASISKQITVDEQSQKEQLKQQIINAIIQYLTTQDSQQKQQLKQQIIQLIIQYLMS
jgi:PKD repeat protein